MLATLLSLLLGSLGIFLLLRGKKLQDVRMMLVGGVLIVLSYWMFG